jgi:hypothetical protein
MTNDRKLCLARIATPTEIKLYNLLQKRNRLYYAAKCEVRRQRNLKKKRRKRKLKNV